MRRFALTKKPNKALHWTAIPLRSIAAGKLGCEALPVTLALNFIAEGLGRRESNA